ncbi:MAG: MATE family efflux transporter [Defluviitaleaceae bacterium]|nr:MATE family efflux transporter [Defluviitaleaceae bacterium]
MNMPRIKNIFATRNMVKEDFIAGDIPSSREAYGTSLRIALPSVVEMTSLSFIGMISTAMVGRLGPEAVAAVGLVSQPRMIFMALFFALNVGVTAVISRRKGQGDQTAARLCVRQAMMIALAISVVMTAMAVSLARPMMQFAGAQYDTIDLATSYFRITSMFLPLNALTMTISAAQRGIGNTRVTMVVNIAANIVNVIFHILLIEGRFGFPRLEVDGAAIAVAISGAVGMVLAIASILKKDAYLKISLRDTWRPDIPMIKSIGKIGGNSIFEQMCMRIGFFAYAIIVASLGTAAFASHQIAMQMMHLSFTFADGIAVATTALVGQQLGAKRPDLSIMYGKIGQRMALIVSIFLVTFSILGRYWFPSMFTNDPSIIAMTAGLMLILAMVQPIQTSQLIMAGCLRGAGDTRFVALTMLLSVALARPLFSLLLVFALGMGLPGAWYAIIADQGLRLIMLYGRFARGKWTEIKI